MQRMSSRQDQNYFIKFHHKDWMMDSRLRQVSLAAKGAWIDILCLMQEENPRGTLTSSLTSLERLLPCSRDEIEAAIKELHDGGVLSLGREIDPRLPEKVLVCRRMYRENMLKMSRQEAGRKGGQSGTGESKRRSSPPTANPAPTSIPTATETWPGEQKPANVEEFRPKTTPAQSPRPAPQPTKPATSRPSMQITQNASRTVGNTEPVSVADIICLSNPANYYESLLERIFVTTGDRAEWKGWWCHTMECLQEHPALLGELESYLKYVEDCADPVTRVMKSLGPLKEPGQYLAAKLLMAARRERVWLPKLPRPGT